MSLLKDFAHLKIPLEDVLSATNNFSDENFIREGGFGRIYKGQLFHSGEKTDIVARRLHPKYGQGSKEFLTEISTLSGLQNEKVVSFIGFCEENKEKIIVNKYEVNSSLDKHVSDPALTWTQRLEICLNVARALSHIYYEKGRDFSVIHRNIKSSKILLDDKWKPKLSGYELSVRNPAARRDRLVGTDHIGGTYGYVDPACEKTRGVTHKSDMFSFGVVLFEVLCGRRAFIPEEPTFMFTMKKLEHLNINPDDELLSRSAKSHYEEETLDDIIDQDLRQQMEQQSYKIFSETAYFCLKEQRTQRPDIYQVIHKLKKALEHQYKYENKGSTFVDEVIEDALSNDSKGRPAPNLSDFVRVVPSYQAHYSVVPPSLSAVDAHTRWSGLHFVDKLARTSFPSSLFQTRPWIAKYTFLCRNPPPIELLPFLSGNPPTNQANENIMSNSLHEFPHLRIPLEDISSATNNFADNNILLHGGDGKLYKGKLKRLVGPSINIVARRLEGIHGQGDIELWTEVSVLSTHKHKNLVSIVGFCDENGEKIIIYEHTGHGSLHQHINNNTLTWTQRLQICLGVAQALNYIHKDIVHCDINVLNILVDNEWDAKVFGFGHSTKYPGNWEHRLLFSQYFETSANRDPGYTNIISVTPKYDVYAFGVLLYVVLCGRMPNGVTEKLVAMVDRDLKKQTSSQSLDILSKIADDCLKRQCVHRPNMDQIVRELGNALDHQKKPENLGRPTLAEEAISFNNVTEKMERLKIPLSEIKLATNNFDPMYGIGKGGFGNVFKATLDHLDFEKILPLDWNKNQLPKRQSIVAIKRIFNKEGEEGFRAEIETLASCNHRNIVSLLGYSIEDREMILVVEFLAKGSLDDCLLNNTMAHVTWAKRVQICLDIAHGLKYLHDNLEGKKKIVHRDIKSANILLDEKWNAKVADFGLSKFNPAGNTLMSAFETKHVVGTLVYMDPDYKSTNIYSIASDIYSFGLVLFEILSGKLTYDPIYMVENDQGLASVARQRYIQGTIKELIDPNMMVEDNEHMFTVNKGPNQKSLDAFTKIAYQCLLETQKERPKIEVIIKELTDALHFQGKTLVLMKFRLSDIQSATKKFSAKYYIGVSTYGMMYNAKLNHFDSKTLSKIEWNSGGELPKTRKVVALKRIFNREDGHGKQGFFAEIDLLASFKHPNILSLLGVSSENQEMILIYKDAFKGSLHDYLGNTHKMAKLTWEKRIEISLDIAQGLKYIQTSTEDKERLMQFDINSANILLDEKWSAKIACFWLSTLNSVKKEATISDTNDIVPRKVQHDSEYIKIEELKKESSIYSFGVILFEILCGKVQYDEIYYAENENEKGLPTIARRSYDDKTILKKLVDSNLKEKVRENSYSLDVEVSQKSFDIFSNIAYRCCEVEEVDRPSIEVIIKELENALLIQVEYLKHLKTEVEKVIKNFEHLKFPLSEVKFATENFSERYIIGTAGGSSMIYKAELVHFCGTVAIKHIHSKAGIHAEELFIAELEALSNCNHPNVVSLLGFCYEDDEMILILEYASNGSLDDFLGNLENMTNLTWAQRLQICINIAQGLDYLHNNIEDKQPMIHRDIKSANILLKDNWVAQIADFGLCKVNPTYKGINPLYTNYNSNIAGTYGYVDPMYMHTGMLRKESDIYSFGVVLFEILSGKLAYDKKFNKDGLAPKARRCFIEGTLKQIVDPRMWEDDGTMFVLNRGLNQDSLDTFSKIAYQCLEESQMQRPTIQEVTEELEKAYYFQINKDKLQISLENIQLMTKNFSDLKSIKEEKYWKQYEGEMAHANGYVTVVVKRFVSNYNKQHLHFLKELEVLSEYKHVNIIDVVGYCQDMNERIIVYEDASNGRLNEHLDNASVTWMKRLNICIDVAWGLHFLHAGGVRKDVPIMHRDIQSACILVVDDWTAKISNLELSLNSWEHEEIEHVSDNAYLDPEYERRGYLTQKSDIYSLGVVLLEILCGRMQWVDGCEDLSCLAKECFKEGKLEELVFEGIKKQICPESLITFANIAFRCLKDDASERPEAREIVAQLNKAVELQEDIDIWEVKLPRDYKEILAFSEIDLSISKKDIYMKLFEEGVLLRDREVCLILGSNGEKCYTISAKKFSYRNRSALSWLKAYDSRFGNVAVITSTLSNLNIKIKIRTWFLSSGVNYGVHLLFRLYYTRSVYVNLTYKMGTQTFHAYFSTFRDGKWPRIELCRFLYHEEDPIFEVLLESFSTCYCGKGDIHFEGIEFRVIDDNEKLKDTDETKQVHDQGLKSKSNEAQVQQTSRDSGEIIRRSEDGKPDKLFLIKEVSKKKQLTLSAKDVLYNSSNQKHFRLKPSAESRFQEMIEVHAEQVLRISCKIEDQMLSKDTEYSCYLVFKLSEKCRGLHCPVKVRDALNRRNNEIEYLYLRCPSPWNLHDFIHIPEQREDGWMEVNVWNFNSSRNLKSDFYRIKLKLISYEGNMSGLMVCGLEFRPT